MTSDPNLIGIISLFHPRLAGRLTSTRFSLNPGQNYWTTGTNHYSLAFTFDRVALSRDTWIDPSMFEWIGGDDDFWDPFLHGQF